MSTERFSAATALAPLKEFQRRTVDYVFDRLYIAANGTRQFLVADEVGLGKTMVARGIIARMIEHQWDLSDRIDVLYICSNQAIAAQNINRLNVINRIELALPTRMTLIPLQVRGKHGLAANKVNFISLTPGTTFDLRSSTGVKEERALIFRMLEDVVEIPRGLRNALEATSGPEGWKDAVATMTLVGIDRQLIDRFRREVCADTNLFKHLERMCEDFHWRRQNYPRDMRDLRNEVVASLRAKLSHACVEALQPDLIIMDEFQRFRDLLRGDKPAALLARELFDYKDATGRSARTLLLSATPYRMLTLASDAPDEGDHYGDLLETLAFLYGQERGREVAAELEREMRAFRSALHGLPASRVQAIQSRQRVERSLRQVMARTERVSNTSDRDAMVCELRLSTAVHPSDLREAAAVSEIARVLDAPEIVEYWKSAPYLLNFMRHYALKQAMVGTQAEPTPALLDALARATPTCLNCEQLDAYAPLNPSNSRMRALMDDVFRDNLERNLWIPPAFPYYGAPRDELRQTKALVFSAWAMVPDAIAALLSYEAERRMGVGEGGRRYFEKSRPRLLQFRHDQGRRSGMRALLLIYPSPTLAMRADPLAILTEHSGPLSYQEVRRAVAARLRPEFDALRAAASGDDDGHAWEWAGPSAIDSAAGSSATAWLENSQGMAELAVEDGFQDHVHELRTAAKRRDFGPLSDSILDLLVDVALGSPAVCALRSLRRIAPELTWDDPALLSAAAKVAWGFRTLFNQHEAMALLRRDDDDRYWHRVLIYSAQHDLQAVLDEYAHYLLDAEGMRGKPAADRVGRLATAMAHALSVRPSQIDVDDPHVGNGQFKVDKFQMRGRFAMRLADYRDEEGSVARLGSVRDAFNSPFRPFVLATTSVGQEGLDFHPYCYRVYHWNLPGNPVDLEQREGRVHRFKCHAVRLNLAHKHGQMLRGCGRTPDDPWETMFAAARAETTVDSELVPYWLYEGPVKVERRVPILPFSREVRRLEWLKRSLTIYRLAFGQPRQDDLLEYLGSSLHGDELSPQELQELQINLEPRPALSGCDAVDDRLGA